MAAELIMLASRILEKSLDAVLVDVPKEVHFHMNRSLDIQIAAVESALEVLAETKIIDMCNGPNGQRYAIIRSRTRGLDGNSLLIKDKAVADLQARKEEIAQMLVDRLAGTGMQLCLLTSMERDELEYSIIRIVKKYDHPVTEKMILEDNEATSPFAIIMATATIQYLMESGVLIQTADGIVAIPDSDDDSESEVVA